MRIGRREFLAVFGGLLSRLALQTSPAIYRENDLYLNRRLGIAFTRPAGWEFVQLADMGEIQQGQQLAIDDPSLSATILGSLDLPFVALVKNDDFQAEQSIAIQFYFAEPPSENDIASFVLEEAFGKKRKSNRDEKRSLPMRKIREDWQISRNLLHSFRVCSLPTDVEIALQPAAEYTARYEFRHNELPSSRMIRVRTVVIEHGDRLYLLRLIDSDDSPFDFNSFLADLHLA